MKYAAIITKQPRSYPDDPYTEYEEFHEFRDTQEMLDWVDKNYNVVKYTLVRFENISFKPDFHIE